MSTALHCDGPGCDTWQKVGDMDHQQGWVKVDEDARHPKHFCSWRCVRAFAERKVPVPV